MVNTPLERNNTQNNPKSYKNGQKNIMIFNIKMRNCYLWTKNHMLSKGDRIVGKKCEKGYWNSGWLWTKCELAV